MRRNTPLETVTALVFLVFVGLILYYAFYPFRVTTLNTISIDAAEYCKGDWVDVEMDFVKHLDVQAEVTWFIVDGIVYQLDSPGVSRPLGGNHFVVSKQIPLSILPGKYHFRIEMTYRVHPLHKPIINSWNTPTFTVKDKGCPTPTSQFLDPVSKPLVSQPTTEKSATVITEEKPQKIEVTPTPENSPLGRLFDKISKPVKGLLK